MKITSYNVNSMKGDYLKILSAIKGSDIVLLQELPLGYADKLKNDSDLEFVYEFPKTGTKGFKKGLAILSKKKVDKIYAKPFNSHKPSGKGALFVRIGDLEIGTVHITLEKQKWARQDILQLAEIAKKRGDKQLIMGDFNSYKWFPRMKKFKKISNMKELPLSGPTFKRFPFPSKIDYIFTKGIEIFKHYITKDGDSDHYPIHVEV